MKASVRALLAVAVLAVAPHVGAAPAAPGSAGTAPGAAASSPHKPPGLLLSFGVGPGLLFATSSSPPKVRRFKGETASFSFLVGGRVTRIFSFGGGYLRDEVFDLRSKDAVPEPGEPDLSHVHFFTSVFGLFGDFLIPTRPELHIQPFLGYGTLYVDGRPTAAGAVDNPSGFIYAGTLSTDFRLANDLTLGAAFRILYAPVSVTETGANSTPVNVFIPALMAVVRYD
ncbi:MAG TPA: hypothetical protein VMI54_15665 [Polyangiaceae bacterium]|nr:hypothetical protein [Polyangiaceae bacterium]